MPRRFIRRALAGRCLLKLLLILAATFALLAITLPFALSRTTLPIRLLAGAAEWLGRNGGLSIEGISGSLRSGFGIRALRWTGGEMNDLRFFYRREKDASGMDAIVLSDVHLGKTRIELGNAPAGTSTTQVHFHSNSSGRGATPPWPAMLLRLEQLTLEDVLISNKRTGFELQMPLAHWAGLELGPGRVRLGEIKVESDRLRIATPAPDHLEGELLPKLHPRIRRTVDFGAQLQQGGNGPAGLLRAFDDRLEFTIQADGSGLLRCNALDLASYFDAPLPQALHLELATQNSDGAWMRPTKLSQGSFTLGALSFTIIPWTAPEGPDLLGPTLTATSNDGNGIIRYTLSLQGGRPRQQLSSEPQEPLEETVARVFFKSGKDSLTGKDAADVRAKVEAFR